jgi:hypothetical protein
MALSTLGLAVLLFLLSAGWLGWFAVSATFLGVVGMIEVLLLLFEGGPLVYRQYAARRV